MMSAARWKPVTALLALLWLMVVLSLYYAGHKPFSPSLVVRLGQGIWQVCAAFGLVAVGGGVGALAGGRMLAGLNLRPSAALALQSGLGLGLLCLLALLLGAIGALRPEILLVTLLALGVLTARQILRWLRAWGDLAGLWEEGGRWDRTIALGAGLIFLVTLATALAPPLKFDALVYHLALPERYLASGGSGYTPENMFWGLPQTAELLYTWAMALGGRPAAAVLGWLVGLLCMIGLVGFLSTRLGSRAAWAAAAALLSGTTLASALAWAYVDWWTILFGAGMLAALDAWRQEGGESFLLLAGVFAGLALGTKYTAGVALLAGLCTALYGGLRWGVPAAGRSMALFGLAAGLVSLPWWLKNALATGNPFYPFFFPAGAMDGFRLDFYQAPAFGGWQEALFLPFRATFLGLEGAPGYSASIGPLLLALAPLAWLGWRSLAAPGRATIGTAAIIGLGGLAVWVLASRFSLYLIQSRLYLALFPAFAVLAGAGFAALDRLRFPGLRVGRVAGALVLLAFAFSVFQEGTAAVRAGALKELFGIITAEEYLETNLGWYARAMQAVRELPAGSRVLMLWEPRSLYCAPACHPDEVLDRWLHDWERAGSPEAVHTAWSKQGYTHLLVYRLGADFVKDDDLRYRVEDWQALGNLLARLPAPARFGEAYELYPLQP